jgi:tetratricopeptide (TPR) repeat protein
LRDALIRAVSTKDYQSVAELINSNSAAIRDAFAAWTQVPLEIRNDPEALGRYAETLWTVASAFERSGDASLMTHLRDSGPTAGWDKDLNTAQTLIDARRPTEAVTLLRRVLDSMGGMSGTGVDYYRPRTLGRLGIALLHSGDKREAVKVTTEALDLCRGLGDEEGIRAYTKNLETIGTYEMPANDGTDANVTVAFRDEQDHTLTPDELRTVRGKVKWEVRGHASVPPEAERLHQEGRAAGARGEYDGARSLLTKAAELAPSWPYPVYDRAFTHLLQRNFDAALADYQRTVALAPGGFFTAEVAVDTLRREAQGEFPIGFYAAFAMLEHMPVEQQRGVAEQLVEKYPSFAAGWDLHANFVTDPRTRLEAIENGLGARPDRETLGSLLVRKAMAMSGLDTGAAIEMLQRLVSDPTASLGTRAKAEFALAHLSPKTPER